MAMLNYLKHFQIEFFPPRENPDREKGEIRII